MLANEIIVGFPLSAHDMTGFVTLGTTKPSGFWDFIQDSGVNNTLWTRVKTVAEIPSGADFVVEVRAANHITELPSWPFQRVQSGGVMPNIHIRGRYLEVRTTLLRDFCPGDTCAGPVLKALSVEMASPPGSTSLTISSHPTSRAVAAGDSVSFTVTAPGATAYQWYKDGAFLSGATSPTLNLSGVSCGDAGVYYVRVQNWPYALRSSPARLHVKGDAPEMNFVSGDLPLLTWVTPGTPSFTITAHVTVSGSGSCSQPPHFQWMHDQLPIAGASGVCALDGGNGWKATLTLNNLQREHGGYYSVVFSNAYGSVLSSVGGDGVQGNLCRLRTDDGDDITPEDNPVHITPYDEEADPSQPVTLTAHPAFAGATCAQWYKVEGQSDVAIPGANDLTYTAPGGRTSKEVYKIMLQDFLYQTYEAYAQIRLPE